MSSREDIIIVYSKTGWDELVTKIGSTILTQFERQEVVKTINTASVHQTNSQGDHMLVFEQLSTGSFGISMLRGLTQIINIDDWKMHSIDESGEENAGWYISSSFNPHVHRSLKWTNGYNVAGALSIPDPPTLSKTNQIINDYTCPHCGNSKLSKQEKTCWSCTNPII